MGMTVKKLIAELEKIENKFLEVEILAVDQLNMLLEIDYVQPQARKVFIRTKECK